MSTNRIDEIFTKLRASNSKAVMPYLTAGDPDLATTGAILPRLEKAGAAICEIGIPFSDPIADGPVIQASMTHALDQGITTTQIFDMIAKQRASLNIGIVAMLSYSIVYRIGHGDSPDDWTYLKRAKEAGFDGLIVPDVAIEEADPLREAAAAHGLTCSFLISPSTPDDRALQIAKACTGFVYVLSRAGITGERTSLPTDLPGRLKRLRDVTDLPIAVGFGVSTREHVEQVTDIADAAIVGSAIMRRIAEVRDQGSDAVADEIGKFVGELTGMH